MTEADLLEDLARLLREGLVMVDTTDVEIDDDVPRFRPTRRGIEQLSVDEAWSEAS